MTRRRKTTYQLLRERVPVRYFEVGDRMLQLLPELAHAVAAFKSEWSLPDPPGPINLIDAIFVPYMESWLADVTSQDVVERAIDFLEELASDQDSSIREISQIAINQLADAVNFRQVVERRGGSVRTLLTQAP